SSMGRRPIEDRRQSIRSTESVASGRDASRAASSGWVAIAHSAPSRNQRAAEGLLPRHGEGEFAVADAPGKTLGETRRRLLAVGRDEFGKGGEQARLRQAVPIDTVEARFGPGCVEVAERSPFLLMVRSLSRNLVHLACHAEADSGPPLRGGTLARDARAPRRNWRNG